MSIVREYYRLAKPGIVYGNAFTTLAAFLYASGWHSPLALFLATLAGICLVVASACAFNNVLDRGIDRRMARTENRPLATGAISVPAALAFGTALGLIGLALLYIYANPLTAALALFGHISYVLIYGWAKRASPWGTVVGSVPGAIPIVVGYAAVTGRVDIPALLLFLMLVCWQMPHFYAIAMYRLDDYRAAGIPVLPAKRGIRATKIHLLAWLVLYLCAVSAFALLGYAGWAYAVIALSFGLAWAWRAIRGWRAPDAAGWARGVFLSSLIALIGLSFALALAPLLP